MQQCRYVLRLEATEVYHCPCHYERNKILVVKLNLCVCVCVCWIISIQSFTYFWNCKHWFLFYLNTGQIILKFCWPKFLYFKFQMDKYLKCQMTLKLFFSFCHRNSHIGCDALKLLSFYMDCFLRLFLPLSLRLCNNISIKG